MKYRHYFAAMTAAVLVLTGCQQINTPAPEQDIGAQMLAETQPPAPDTTPLTDIVRCDPVTLPDELSGIWMASRTKDGFGGIAITPDDQASYLQISEDMQTASAFVLTPPADQGDFTLSTRWFAFDDDEIWAIAVMESHGGLKPYDPETDSGTYDWESWEDAEEKQYLLCRYAVNGTLVSAIPANDLLDYRSFYEDRGFDQLKRFEIAAGELYLTLSDGRVLRIDKETAAISVVTDMDGDNGSQNTHTLCFDRDDKPMMLQVMMDGLAPDKTNYSVECTLLEYDLAAGTAGQVFFSSQGTGNDAAIQVQKGSGEYRVFVTTADKLIGIRDDGSQEVLIDMDASDLFNMQVFPLDQEHFLGYQYLDGGKIQAYRLTRKHESEIPQTEVLTLGITGDARSDHELYALVKNFNRTHEGYRIEFSEYPIDNTSRETYRASEEAFRQSLTSGQGPDILMLSAHEDAVSIGKQGELLDLYSLMDKDALFGRDKFVPNVLTALESPDGRLYGMPRMFHVSTIAVKKKFTEKENWTFDDLLALYADAGDQVYRWQTKQEVFSTLTEGLDLADENGAYHFDSPEFLRLLEFCDRFPVSRDSLENSYANVNDFYMDQLLAGSRDEELFVSAMLSSMGNSPACSYSYAKYYTFGGDDITFAGYPSEDGQGGKINTPRELAISSHTPHPDVAWEFVKAYLQQRNDEGDTLSVLNDRFEQELDACMSAGTFRGQSTQEYYVDDGIKIYPMTQAERDDVERYIRSCTKHMPVWDVDIMDIVYDETEKFFNGAQNAEDTAKAIQKRVQRLLDDRQ